MVALPCLITCVLGVHAATGIHREAQCSGCMARYAGVNNAGNLMSVVVYRCPTSFKEVTTTIETGKDTLAKMGAKKLTNWLWCPHCVEGHQINSADAVVRE